MKESPRTLRKMNQNEEAVKHREVARKSSPTEKAPAEKAPELARITVSDIKALSSASVKPDVIIAEIEKSKSSSQCKGCCIRTRRHEHRSEGHRLYEEDDELSSQTQEQTIHLQWAGRIPRPARESRSRLAHCGS